MYELSQTPEIRMRPVFSVEIIFFMKNTENIRYDSAYSRGTGVVCVCVGLLEFLNRSFYPMTSLHPVSVLIKITLHSTSCEIEDFVGTHLCKLCVILRSRVLLGGVCPY